MTRRSIITASRIEAARKGWETRKANEASRARRFDEVLAENRRLKEDNRNLLDALRVALGHLEVATPGSTERRIVNAHVWAIQLTGGQFCAACGRTRQDIVDKGGWECGANGSADLVRP